MRAVPSVAFPFRGKQVRQRGGNPGDETFTLASVGMINISRIIDRINTHPHLFDPVLVTAEQDLNKILRRTRDIDPRRIAEISKDDLDNACAIGVIINGACEVIDGNHYIVAATEAGYKTYRIILMPESMLKEFLITWEVKENGKWRTITAEEILAASSGTYGGKDGLIRDAAGNVIYDNNRRNPL